MEEGSWRRNHERGIMGQRSWRRHGGGIMEEESSKRLHREGIWRSLEVSTVQLPLSLLPTGVLSTSSAIVICLASGTPGLPIFMVFGRSDGSHAVLQWVLRDCSDFTLPQTPSDSIILTSATTQTYFVRSPWL